MAKRIEIKCYGQTEFWANRDKAKAFYEEGILSCDPASSESSRYVFIWTGLECGANYIDADKEEWDLEEKDLLKMLA